MDSTLWAELALVLSKGIGGPVKDVRILRLFEAMHVVVQKIGLLLE